MTTSSAPGGPGTPARRPGGHALLQRIGVLVGLVGSAGGLVGSLWHLLLPTPDANIGAGALVLLGTLLSLGGAAVLALRVLLRRIETRRVPT